MTHMHLPDVDLLRGIGLMIVTLAAICVWLWASRNDDGPSAPGQLPVAPEPKRSRS